MHIALYVLAKNNLLQVIRTGFTNDISMSWRSYILLDKWENVTNICEIHLNHKIRMWLGTIKSVFNHIV